MIRFGEKEAIIVTIIQRKRTKTSTDRYSAVAAGKFKHTNFP